jgi:hypothetical protein
LERIFISTILVVNFERHNFGRTVYERGMMPLQKARLIQLAAQHNQMQ